MKKNRNKKLRLLKWRSYRVYLCDDVFQDGINYHGARYFAGLGPQ